MPEFRGVIGVITAIANKNQRHALRCIQILLCLTSHLCTTASHSNQTVIWENNIPQRLCLWMLTSQEIRGRNIQHQLKSSLLLDYLATGFILECTE